MSYNETNELWRQYVAAEEDRIRPVSLEALNAFIDVFGKLDAVQKANWVFKFLDENFVGHTIDFPVRMPLFRVVLFPELLEGVLAKRAGAARYLGHMEQYLYKNRDLGGLLPTDLQNAYGLYQAAILQDPSDLEARRSLAEKHFGWLSYTLHELPWGVLVDANGATLERMGELTAQLDEFKALASDMRDAEGAESLIVACEFHYREYEHYLKRSDEWPSYKVYLDANHAGKWPDF